MLTVLTGALVGEEPLDEAEKVDINANVIPGRCKCCKTFAVSIIEGAYINILVLLEGIGAFRPA